MTECPNGEVRDLLPDLMHDRLAPDVRRDVDAHVRTCADCQQELALLRSMRSTLPRVPAVDVAAIAAAIPAYRAPARRAWVGRRAAAAILILAAGGTSVAVLGRGGEVTVDSLRADGSPIVALAPTIVQAESASPGAPAASVAAVSAPRELAMANGAISDLDDGELSALLKDLETLEMLPSADVENGAAISPVAPAETA
jgi:hypothetical protein